ncbi:MAG: fused DSP-PTPase phosphatase/NAD kinase-like protein [Saccharospirillum sp.]
MVDEKRGWLARYRQWRKGWSEQFDRPVVRMAAWLEATFIDHGFLRPLWNNPKPITATAWRGNQPNRWQIKRLAARGVRTVVSLRGLNNAAGLFEIEACRRAGVELIPFKMSSRGTPKAERVLAFSQMVHRVDKPVLFHCKSGADRSGFAMALYLILTGEGTIEQARAQLSWRYLHFKGAKTGRLDAFLAAYQRAYEATGVDLLTWVQTEYDPDEINRNFQPKGFSSWLVDRVLRRE